MTTLPLSVCRLKVLGASPSWSPRDLSMSVEGELYFYQLQALTADAVSLCSNWQSFRSRGFSLQHRSGYLAPSSSWFSSVSSFKCRDKTFVSSHISDHTIEWSKSSLFFFSVDSDNLWIRYSVVKCVHYIKTCVKFCMQKNTVRADMLV